MPVHSSRAGTATSLCELTCRPRPLVVERGILLEHGEGDRADEAEGGNQVLSLAKVVQTVILAAAIFLVGCEGALTRTSRLRKNTALTVVMALTVLLGLEATGLYHPDPPTRDDGWPILAFYGGLMLSVRRLRVPGLAASASDRLTFGPSWSPSRQLAS